MFRPKDQWKETAQEARRQLGEVELVTTDEILTEFLTGMSRSNPFVREQAVAAVQAMLRDGIIRVIPQTRPSFLDGLNQESFFVRHAYFLGADDPYKSLKTTLRAEIDEDAWATLHSTTSRPFPPELGRIAVKVINHLGDEAIKVLRVGCPPNNSQIIKRS